MKYPKKDYNALESLIDALHKRSRSLTKEESQIYDKIILEKLKYGFPII